MGKSDPHLYFIWLAERIIRVRFAPFLFFSFIPRRPLANRPLALPYDPPLSPIYIWGY